MSKSDDWDEWHEHLRAMSVLPAQRLVPAPPQGAETAFGIATPPAHSQAPRSPHAPPGATPTPPAEPWREQRAAARRMLLSKARLPDREIARRTGVTHGFVGRWRRILRSKHKTPGQQALLAAAQPP
jgi:hypothetical protein